MGNIRTEQFQEKITERLMKNNELTLGEVAKMFRMTKQGASYHLDKICSKSVLVKKNGVYSLSVQNVVASTTQPLEERIVKLERQVKVLIAALVTSGRQIDQFALNLD